MYRHRRGFAALLQQRLQRGAAQLVPFAARQKSRLAARQHLNAVCTKRRAAGFGQRPLHGGQWVLLCGLGRVFAGNNGVAALGVGDRHADALRRKADREIHRHPFQLPAEQLPGFGRGGTGGGSVRLGAHAEHGLAAAPGQVTVAEPRAGENIPHQRLVIGPALPRGAAGGHGGRRVLRRAQPSLNLDAGHPGGLQFCHVGDQVHVLQAQVTGGSRLAGTQVSAGVKGQAAGSCAVPPVAAAPAQKGAHHALPAHGHTHGAVNKDLALDGALAHNVTDFGKAQLPGQNRPGIPQLCQHFGALGGMDAHLGGAVQSQVRGDGPHQRCGGQVVQNHRVGPRPGNGPHRAGQPLQLVPVDQRVEGDMDRHPPGMTKAHRLPQGLRCEISGAAPGVIAIQPQIYRVRPGKHRSAQHLGIAGGGQNLRCRHQPSWFRRRRRSSTFLRSAAFSRRSSSAAILALAASSR